MATAAQINANIQNAQHSTGPVTEEGKAQSSQNALKHGLSSGTTLIAGENPEEYRAMRRNLREEYRPQGNTENILVQQMAISLWLARRAIGLQAQAFNQSTSSEAPKSLAIYMRYQASNERAFHKSLETLRKIQAERLKKESEERVGFLLHSTPQELVDKLAEGYRQETNGDELDPEIIEAMLQQARQPQNSAASPAR